MTAARISARTWLRWHRRVGFVLAALFVVVAGTGLLLNHGEALGLRGKQIEANWLFRWYGLQPAGDPRGFAVGNGWIVALDGDVFVGERWVARLPEVKGAVRREGVIAVAGASSILLLTREGELVESLVGGLLPQGSIERIGIAANESLVVQTSAGTFAAVGDFLGWRPDDGGNVVWSEPSPLPRPMEQQVLTEYRGEGLTLHRIVTDVHSGRFFGPIGVVIVDLVTLGLLFLVATGIWYAFATRRNA